MMSISPTAGHRGDFREDQAMDHCPNCDLTDEGVAVFKCNSCGTRYCYSLGNFSCCASGSGATVGCPNCDNLVIGTDSTYVGTIGSDEDD